MTIRDLPRHRFDGRRFEQSPPSRCHSPAGATGPFRASPEKPKPAIGDNAAGPLAGSILCLCTPRLSLPAGRRGQSGRRRRRGCPRSCRPGWPPPRTLPRRPATRHPTTSEAPARTAGAGGQVRHSVQRKPATRAGSSARSRAAPNSNTRPAAGRWAPSQTTSTRRMPKDSASASTCRPQTHSPRRSSSLESL